MKKALFTICAKNYIGLSLALKKAVEQYSTDVTFFIFVADELEAEQRECLSENVLESKTALDIEPRKWESMAYKYNLVEFCTALKPFTFGYLMDKDFDKVIYCDPDIFFFSNFDFIYKELDTCLALLTPHEIHPQRIPAEVRRDFEALRSGVFNLGFAAFRNTLETREVMHWWANRLEDYAVSEVTDGLFTDQKWMDFLPALLPDGALKVSRNPGMNCAPWNFHERNVLSTPEGFRIQSRYEDQQEFPLVFFHCAGYDYRKLMSDNPQSAYLQTELTPGIKDLLEACSQRLKASDFESYLLWSYSYAMYDNGAPISYFQRRMFRRLNSEGYSYTNLFSSQGNLYRLLLKNKLIYQEPMLAEKAKPSEIQGFEYKVSMIDFCVRMIKCLFGSYRYVLFCKLLNKYFRYENQVRLLDKSFKHIRIK